jgi:hypothetical protein
MGKLMALKWTSYCKCGYKYSTLNSPEDAVEELQIHLRQAHGVEVTREYAQTKIKEVGETHASKYQLPEKRIGDIYETRKTMWGGINVSFEKALSDMDVTPYPKGLPDGMDQSPHWGYVFKGKIIIQSKDQKQVVNAGEAYYTPAGSTTTVTGGTELIEFNPQSEEEKTLAVEIKRIQELEAEEADQQEKTTENPITH